MIECTFGRGSRHLKDFDSIGYSLRFFAIGGTPDSAFDKAYIDGLETARKILSSMIEELDEFGTDDVEGGTDTRITLGAIVDRFHLVARQLRSRHADRATLEIEDEYDVQDLLHALLQLISDDIRKEEWTPLIRGRQRSRRFPIETRTSRSGSEENQERRG